MIRGDSFRVFSKYHFRGSRWCAGSLQLRSNGNAFHWWDESSNGGSDKPDRLLSPIQTGSPRRENRVLSLAAHERSSVDGGDEDSDRHPGNAQEILSVMSDL